LDIGAGMEGDNEDGSVNLWGPSLKFSLPISSDNAIIMVSHGLRQLSHLAGFMGQFLFMQEATIRWTYEWAFAGSDPES
jgi:hypothetical protein